MPSISQCFHADDSRVIANTEARYVVVLRKLFKQYAATVREIDSRIHNAKLWQLSIRLLVAHLPKEPSDPHAILVQMSSTLCQSRFTHAGVASVANHEMFVGSERGRAQNSTKIK